VEIKNSLLDSTQRDRAVVDRLYRASDDPYGFTRDREQFRFQRAMQMLSAVGNGRPFGRTLEVGCAEGMFTERLADCCESVLAVDLASIALERAKRRCRNRPNITFVQWNVRKDVVDGTFDLIVATGVLEYILRRRTLRGACDRLIRALRPGGYLLLGNTVTQNEMEHTWIGKRLIRGTLINDYVGSDPRLETVSASLDQCVCPFAHLLLRRRSD
jgi:2-polyprenyl-3-methyl-5-hydroxy-6-metoxy-1,4-benzoquinol methylase